MKKNPKQTKIQEFQKKFDSFNEILNKMNLFYQKKAYFSEFLEKILKIIPEKAYLNSIYFNFPSPDDNSFIQISLWGYIPKREDLFEFKKNLEKEEWIKDVSFPPENWINPVDINFSVTFKAVKK